MSNCLHCSKPLKNKPGYKAKKYCDDTCRQKHWQNNKKKTKTVSIQVWNELLAEIEQLQQVKQLYNKLLGQQEPEDRNGQLIKKTQVSITNNFPPRNNVRKRPADMLDNEDSLTYRIRKAELKNEI